MTGWNIYRFNTNQQQKPMCSTDREISKGPTARYGVPVEVDDWAPEVAQIWRFFIFGGSSSKLSIYKQHMVDFCVKYV